jgi:hypothetical protein
MTEGRTMTTKYARAYLSFLIDPNPDPDRDRIELRTGTVDTGRPREFRFVQLSLTCPGKSIQELHTLLHREPAAYTRPRTLQRRRQVAESVRILAERLVAMARKTQQKVATQRQRERAGGSRVKRKTR